jgi:hypothetical protein
MVACCFSMGRTGLSLYGAGVGTKHEHAIWIWIMNGWIDGDGHEHTHMSIGISIGIRTDSTCVSRALYHYTILHLLFKHNYPLQG